MNKPISEETLLGKIALLAHKNKQSAFGETPSLEELAMLYDNQLDFNRKQEVLSHINSDPLLFEQFMNLVDVMYDNTTANQHVAESKNSSFTQLLSWLFSWKGLTGSVASASLVVIIVLQFSPTSPLTPLIEQPSYEANHEASNNGSKNGTQTASFISPDKRAIAAGIANASNDNVQQLKQLDLSIAINQQGSALEANIYQQYFQLGELLAEWEQLCRQDKGANTVFIQQFSLTINQISTESFIPVHQNLVKLSQAKQPEQACDLLQQFLLSEF